LIALNVATPVEEQLAHDPVSGQLFVFVNKKRDKIKIPYWERAGFCLWRKRLERERFKWPDHLLGNVLTLDGQQLNWLPCVRTGRSPIRRCCRKIQPVAAGTEANQLLCLS
jgi:transposase